LVAATTLLAASACTNFPPLEPALWPEDALGDALVLAVELTEDPLADDILANGAADVARLDDEPLADEDWDVGVLAMSRDCLSRSQSDLRRRKRIERLPGGFG
jgi:hypothetical protein